MSILDDPKLMRDIIMDHYEYPHNKSLKNDTRYIKVHMDSESCIDDIYVEALIENNIVKDICFDGIGCTISTASTSIMTDLLKDKTIEEAEHIIQEYFNMIQMENFDEDLLEEAVVFKNTGRQANRIKCATIGWQAIKEIIDQSKEIKEGE